MREQLSGDPIGSNTRGRTMQRGNARLKIVGYLGINREELRDRRGKVKAITQAQRSGAW